MKGFTVIRKTPPHPRQSRALRVISKNIPVSTPKKPKRKTPCMCPVCRTHSATTEEQFNVSGDRLTCKACGTVIKSNGQLLSDYS